MKKILNNLFEYKSLSREEARDILINISQGKYNETQIATFITVFLMRSITVDELFGFRNALLELATKIDIDYDIIDLCGTGGDGKDTFNISTIASFIVAGAGYKVAKHGNYSATSVCGSSNVLEYKFSNNSDKIKQSIEKANIAYLHAPLFHPAMKSVANIRKNLGVRTFFNMLGPLINPLQPKYSFTGVFNHEILRIYNYIYQETNNIYSIVHSLDGYDEISLTSKFKIITNNLEEIISPHEIGFNIINPTDIYGGNTVEEAATKFINILKTNELNNQSNVAIVNAAYAIKCINSKLSINEAINIAKESLLSGNAYKCFKQLINLNNN